MKKIATDEFPNRKELTNELLACSAGGGVHCPEKGRTHKTKRYCNDARGRGSTSPYFAKKEGRMQVDQTKLNEFLGQFVQELGAAMNVALVVLGDRLGLYKAMAGAGPM